MDGEAAENGYGDGLRHVAPDASRRRCMERGPGGQRVVTHDNFIRTCHERARSPFKLIVQCTLFEPAFERRLDAQKSVNAMRRVQWDGRRNRWDYLSQGAALLSRRFRALLGLTGASSSLAKRW